VWLGGDSSGTRLATPVAERVFSGDLPALLRPLLERYRDERLAGEALGGFLPRAEITTVEYTPSVPLRALREEATV
jgi:sulfite reductase (ferredoxin)